MCVYMPICVYVSMRVCDLPVKRLAYSQFFSSSPTSSLSGWIGKGSVVRFGPLSVTRVHTSLIWETEGMTMLFWGSWMSRYLICCCVVFLRRFPTSHGEFQRAMNIWRTPRTPSMQLTAWGKCKSVGHMSTPEHAHLIADDWQPSTLSCLKGEAMVFGCLGSSKVFVCGFTIFISDHKYHPPSC